MLHGYIVLIIVLEHQNMYIYAKGAVLVLAEHMKYTYQIHSYNLFESVKPGEQYKDQDYESEKFSFYE